MGAVLLEDVMRDSSTYRASRRNSWYAIRKIDNKIRIMRRLKKGNKDLVNFASSIKPQKAAAM